MLCIHHLWEPPLLVLIDIVNCEEHTLSIVGLLFVPDPTLEPVMKVTHWYFK